MRADSAVEPTRSENITVTWRRSAVASARGTAVGGGADACAGAGAASGVTPANSAIAVPPMPK
jgi:hypothetical protein